MADNTTAGYAPFDLYPYNPSEPPAFAFLAMFAATGISHMVAMVIYRCIFPIPIVIGCGMEAAAYYFRTQSHDDIRKTLPFLIQNLLLLSAPPFIAASVYMSPRRIARALEHEDSIIHPRLATKLFVLVDIVCFGTQVAGSIMSGSEDANEASTGRTTIVAGLLLQIAAFCLFVAWAANFHVRLQSSSMLHAKTLDWQRCMGGLYAVSVLLVVRNITRIVEFQQGADGPMLSSEVYLYILDSSVILAIVVAFLILHPAGLRYKARQLSKRALSDSEIRLDQVSLDDRTGTRNE